jgi:hypothetical protein
MHTSVSPPIPDPSSRARYVWCGLVEGHRPTRALASDVCNSNAGGPSACMPQYRQCELQGARTCRSVSVQARARAVEDVASVAGASLAQPLCQAGQPGGVAAKVSHLTVLGDDPEQFTDRLVVASSLVEG